MIPDPNDEILAIKRRLAARFGNDLHRIAEDIRQRQTENGSVVVSFPPRRYEPVVLEMKSLPRSGERELFDAENHASQTPES